MAGPATGPVHGRTRRAALGQGLGLGLAWTGLLCGPVVQAATARRHERRRLFGSWANLQLPTQVPQAIGQAVWQGLQALHQGWNAWKPGELRALNQAIRAGRPARVSPALARVLREATQLEQQSEGLFNPAIGAWVAGWGFHADELGQGPAPDARTRARWAGQRPSLAGLQWQGDRLYSPNPWVQLDLGAYGKGVALDWALDSLRQRGVDHALLNLGGNLAAMGMPGGQAWRVGIQHPQGPGLIAWLEVQGRQAVVTSGSYERRRRLPDGGVCHHILDPRTGAPAEAACSVTVVHPSAAVADAAATALLVADAGQWRRLAARMGVDQVLRIGPRGEWEATAALAPRLHRL